MMNNRSELPVNVRLGRPPEPKPRRTYSEFAPPPHLRDHVVCIWHRGVSIEPAQAHVLPDGCVDIIWVNDQAPFVVGPMTAPTRPTTAARTEIVGVRLRPGTAHALLGVSARDLLDQDVPLRALWNHRHCAPWDNASAHETVPGKLAAIEAAITTRLVAMEPADPLVTWAARWITRHPRTRIDDLYGSCDLGERQVRRRFEDAIGYGPKLFQRIMRLQFLLWLASQERAPRPDLARLAFAAGYADQPHMTRDVQVLTGTSPRRLLCDAAPVSAVADLFRP
jgi:methylphosphotriester-DNA--protein-cysteine methyltransferase